MKKLAVLSIFIFTMVFMVGMVFAADCMRTVNYSQNKAEQSQ